MGTAEEVQWLEHETDHVPPSSTEVNPLAPGLNASCSGCLPELFSGVFKFQCMPLEKKIVSHTLFLQI